MRGVLVDSNVLLDVLTEEPEWFAWSSESLARCADEAEIVLNPIVYAEVSVGFETVEEGRVRHYSTTSSCGARCPGTRPSLPASASRAYRRRGGQKRSPLPDFYIGAHAAVSGLSLLTRDPVRYRTYFPEAQLIAPARRGERSWNGRP